MSVNGGYPSQNSAAFSPNFESYKSQMPWIRLFPTQERTCDTFPSQQQTTPASIELNAGPNKAILIIPLILNRSADIYIFNFALFTLPIHGFHISFHFSYTMWLIQGEIVTDSVCESKSIQSIIERRIMKLVLASRWNVVFRPCCVIKSPDLFDCFGAKCERSHLNDFVFVQIPLDSHNRVAIDRIE